MKKVALLRELISNNENDIIVKIKRCVNLESKNFDIHSYHWLRSLLALIAEIVLITYIIRKCGELFYVNELIANDSRVSTNYHNEINIFKAAKKYREAFLEAEENRIMEIIEILKSYSEDEKIIADYEKRLDNNQKRRTLKSNKTKNKLV